MQSKKSQQVADKEIKTSEPMAVMGRIVGSFGVHGWVKILPFTESVNGLFSYPIWWLGDDNGEWNEIKVIKCNAHAKILIALLSINLAPLLAIITGSKIIFEILILFNALITELITFEECNIPIFIASGLMSLDVKII